MVPDQQDTLDRCAAEISSAATGECRNAFLLE